jgi:hypothetical protein
VHPAETLVSLQSVIETLVNGVRQARRLDTMGSGLWLTAAVADELVATPSKCEAFRDQLRQHRIRLFTLNGFPFGNFHADSVKERVYLPDWSQPERYAYTQKLSQILAFCLPDDMAEGTISTLPLGYRQGWSESRHRNALKALCELAHYLADLKHSSGRSIRVCLEMEPDCVLETTDEMIVYFQRQLPVQAASMGIDAEAIHNHLGVCFDICHQAVMFEEVEQSMSRLLAAGIGIGKIQVSSALELRHPEQSGSRQVLREFAEPKYLHQVRTLHNHELTGCVDLGEALDSESFPRTEPWRIHFHVPIQSTTLAQKELNTTQDAIVKVLDFLQITPQCRPHLEVETYTWQVLPVDLRPQNQDALIMGLTAELDWLEQAMSARDLLD